MVEPSTRQRRLGQNFLADPNLLDAIVRESGAGPDDVVLEIGGGEGALSERLAPAVARLHVVEFDQRLREPLGELTESHPNVSVLWGDALKADLSELDPPPTMVVSNLPYSVATPVLIRTIEQLPGVSSWTVMVQREIADRLRAKPGSRLYGSPTVIVGLACEVALLRTVDRAVFRPRPRVDSALLRLRRRGPAADSRVSEVVRGAFAHRRKKLAASLELAGVAGKERARAALGEAGLDAGVRAEALSPPDFERLAEALR